MAKRIFKIITDKNHPIFTEGWTIATRMQIPHETRQRWLKEKEEKSRRQFNGNL
jgi:hypothetical protein